MSVLATACPPPEQPALPPPPCTSVSVTETELANPYQESSVPTATSPDGRIRVFTTSDQLSIGLGSYATTRVHLWARDTTTGDEPVEVYWFDTRGGVFPWELYASSDGYPMSWYIDEVPDDGSGAVVRVTYGQRHALGLGGPYVGAPYRTYRHVLAC